MDLALAPVIFLAFYLLGEKTCDGLGLRFSGRGERAFFSTAVGHVCFSLIIAVLVFSRLAYPASFAILLGAVFLLRGRRLIDLGKTFAGRLQGFRVVRPRFANLPFILLGVLVFMALLRAATPPFGTDALVYHLAVPKAYLENHGLVHLPNNIYALYPQQVEMLYLLALALGGGALAQWLGFGLVLLLLFGLYLFFRAWAGPRCATLPPLLLLSTPTFFKVSTSAYIDLQLAGFIFLSFYCWTLWRARRHDGWFLLMAVFAGAAFATKLTGAIALPLAFLGLLLEARTRNNIAWTGKMTLWLGGLSLALILPWWARNYYFTGNPFAPFFMQFFGGEQAINWDAERGNQLMQYLKLFGMGHGVRDFLLLPWNLTVHAAEHSLRFDGQIGPAYLLLLPGLLFLRRNALPMAAVFFVLIVFWFQQTQQIRMLAPAFVFLALLLPAGFARMTAQRDSGSTRGAPGHYLALGILTLALVFNFGLIVMDWLRVNPLTYLTGQETQEAFITRHIPSYPLFQAMNEELAPDAVVLFVYMQNFGYFSERRFVSDTFQEAHTLQSMIANDASPAGLMRQFKALGITDLLINDDFVFGKNSAFSPAGREALRTFLAGHARLVTAKNGYSLFHFVVD